MSETTKENEIEIVVFHGGCIGCTQQAIQPKGVDYCIGCQYFDADWKLPNLNNKEPSEADKTRRELKQKFGITEQSK